MGIIKNYLKVYLKALNFTDVSDENEYLLFNFVNLFLIIILYNFNIVYLLSFFFIILLPSLSLNIRRLNDQKKSWVYILLNCIPYIGWLIFFIICLLPSKKNITDNSDIKENSKYLTVEINNFAEIVNNYKKRNFLEVISKCDEYLNNNSFEIEKEDSLNYSFEDISEFLFFINNSKELSTKIIWNESKYVDFLYYKALALFELNKHDESIEVLMCALDYSPVGIKYRFEIIENLISKKQFSEAEDYLEDLKYNIIKLNDFARLYRRIGHLKIELNLLIDAKICFDLSNIFENSEIAENEIKYISERIDVSEFNYTNNSDSLIKEAIERNLILELSEQQIQTMNQLIDYNTKEWQESKIEELSNIKTTISIFNRFRNYSDSIVMISNNNNNALFSSTMISSVEPKISNQSHYENCPRCNEKLNSESIYCSKCGKKISKSLSNVKKKNNLKLKKKLLYISLIIIIVVSVIYGNLYLREKQRIELAMQNPELYWIVKAIGNAYFYYEETTIIPGLDQVPRINLPKIKCVVTEIEAIKNIDSLYYLDDTYDDSKIKLSLKSFSLNGYSPLTSNTSSVCLDLNFAQMRIQYDPILRNNFELVEGEQRYLLFEIPFNSPNDLTLKYNDEVIMIYE